MTGSNRSGGSRYLYEPFNATAAKVQTIEAVSDERFRSLDRRLDAIEATLERLERRLWLAVYGVVALFLAEAAYSLMNIQP